MLLYKYTDTTWFSPPETKIKFSSSHTHLLQKKKKKRKEQGKEIKQKMTVPTGISSSNSFARSSLWHSPVPYLFAGISTVLLLIVVALVVLACSHKKLPNSDVENSSSGPKPEIHVCSMSPVDREPAIFVIVPGEMLPSFLAKPAVASNELQVYKRLVYLFFSFLILFSFC